MDYIFGTVTVNGVAKENLKTKGETHTDLTGYTQTVREYNDSTITDRFRAAEHYRQSEDSEGNCYDWYVIDNHYRYVDKTGALAEKAAAQNEALENALCEQDEAVDARLTDIEDAICELDAAING